MDANQQKAVMYGKGGLPDPRLMDAPLRATEQHHEHRATDVEPCFDCGNDIQRGYPKIVSLVTVSHGVKAQSFSMSIHPECYEILREVMAIVPLEAKALWGAGRLPLKQIWYKHRDAIENANPPLGIILLRAFGENNEA